MTDHNEHQDNIYGRQNIYFGWKLCIASFAGMCKNRRDQLNVIGVKHFNIAS